MEPIEREPNGRRKRRKPEPDAGTPELRRRRLEMAGPDGDPARTTHLIDILRTRGLLSGMEADAAWTYLTCYSALFGAPGATAVNLNSVSGGKDRLDRLSDGRAERVEETWRTFREVMGRDAEMVRRVVVDEIAGKWLLLPPDALSADVDIDKAAAICASAGVPITSGSLSKERSRLWVLRDILHRMARCAVPVRVS